MHHLILDISGFQRRRRAPRPLPPQARQSDELFRVNWRSSARQNESRPGGFFLTSGSLSNRMRSCRSRALLADPSGKAVSLADLDNTAVTERVAAVGARLGPRLIEIALDIREASKQPFRPCAATNASRICSKRAFAKRRCDDEFLRHGMRPEDVERSDLSRSMMNVTRFCAKRRGFFSRPGAAIPQRRIN